MRLAALCCCFALVCAVVAGCGGSGLDLSPVTGKVTLDGAPLEGATVEFQPTGEGGSPSYGTTDASGSYDLMFTFDKRGATPGDYTVRITKPVVTDADSGEEEETLPKRYNRDTELKATVDDGKTVVDFDLKSGGAEDK